tara:strand:+ start:461 stop:595 length:135 start_codon:yes stop_codon:yes gene_type:complete
VAGLGCTSKNNASTPHNKAVLANGSTYCLSPPVVSPHPPGSCVE